MCSEIGNGPDGRNLYRSAMSDDAQASNPGNEMNDTRHVIQSLNKKSKGRVSDGAKSTRFLNRCTSFQ